jgi:RNase P protein component
MRFISIVLAVTVWYLATAVQVQAVCINVWVHGTYPALKMLQATWLPFRKMVYVQPGLSLAKNLPKNYYFAQLANYLHTHDQMLYDIEHFYTYGWHSSNVRPGFRIMHGKQLYQEINELLAQYQGHHENITVRCIGFSHGGNVILNMLPSLPFEHKNVKLEVVLIATPIQESTRSFINSSHVAQAYSIYSPGDWIQKIDAQRFHHNCPKGAPFFSQRTFHDDDCVHQVCLTVNSKKIGHANYRNIMKYFSDIYHQITDLAIKAQGKKNIKLNYVVPGSKKKNKMKSKKLGKKKFTKKEKKGKIRE